MDLRTILSGLAGALVGAVVVILSFVRAVNGGRRSGVSYGHAGKPSEHRGKRPIETSKLLAYWVAAIASLSLLLPFILSYFDKQPVSEVTHTVFPACIGYLITYAGKSLGEKMSRNKHGLDENGMPFDTDTEV